MAALQVTQVADGVHRASTGLVNWYLLCEGDAVTLVDAGYPGDAGRVRASLEAIGRRLGDVAAILVTHAHIDHIGAIPDLLDETDVPVYLSATEVAHARRDYLEQAGERDVALRAWNPRVLAWSMRILALGATKEVRVPDGRPFGEAEPLDLPGRLAPVSTPGHTSGHSAFHLPEAGAVITGDALVTGHPISGRGGPQMLPGFFHHDLAEARSTLDAIAALDAETILPGHGEPWHGSLTEAVEQARHE